MLAWPDDHQVRSRVERMLEAFARRADIKRFRRELEDTGIAGTSIRFAFYAPTAAWLARRFPGQISIDWADFENRDRLERMLDLLVHWSETPALDEAVRSVRRWVETLKGPRETDAAFLIRRFESLRAEAPVRQRLYEELDVPIVVSPGPGTPTRTLALHRSAAVVFRTRPLRRDRPELDLEVRRPPRSVRAVSEVAAGELVDLAREAMVTRSRDLDAFMFADPRDVRLIDCGSGLRFACIGVIPERRLLLEAVYGFLTLQNGVPVGYVLASALMRSCEVAFNVFESFRGGESAHVYARALSMCRALFRADTFTIYPYQLGHGNDEGLRSGAWWFYEKLGFRPRDAGALRILGRERAALRRAPAHRSSLATLRALSARNLFWSLGRRREDVIGSFPLEEIGFAASAYLAGRFGADRERGAEVCAEEAARALAVPSWKRLAPPEREAFRRWAPLALILPGIETWSLTERRALARVIRAKGGRRESEFVRLFDRHARLRAALRELAGSRVPSDRVRSS